MVGDLFHVGHLNLLKRASRLGSKLIVGVIEDNIVYKYKGRYPIYSMSERIEIISSIRFVDNVIPQYSRDGTDNVKMLGNINIIVRGDDAILENEKNFIESVGGSYIQLARTPNISTTNIILKIKG